MILCVLSLIVSTIVYSDLCDLSVSYHSLQWHKYYCEKWLDHFKMTEKIRNSFLVCCRSFYMHFCPYIHGWCLFCGYLLLFIECQNGGERRINQNFSKEKQVVKAKRSTEKAIVFEWWYCQVVNGFEIHRWFWMILAFWRMKERVHKKLQEFTRSY